MTPLTAYALGVATPVALALIYLATAFAWTWATQRSSLSCAVCPGRPRFGSDVELGRPLYAWQWIRWQAHALTARHRAARHASPRRG